ncbi:unnamed protein product [Tilletia controversa]|nr:unnamed protein product [Tilletia controversa]
MRKILSREAEILEELSQFDGFVKLVGKEEEPFANTITLYMEYCESGSLDGYIKDHLARNYQVAPREILLFAAQMLSALDRLHRPVVHAGSKLLFQGAALLHRDIKPANIMILGKAFKLGDVGIARTLEEGSLAGTRIGTPAYQTPEMLTKSPQYDGRADVFSLGMTVYELAAGRLPFPPPSDPERNAKIKSGPPEIKYDNPADAAHGKLLNTMLRGMLSYSTLSRPQVHEVFENWPELRAIMFEAERDEARQKLKEVEAAAKERTGELEGQVRELERRMTGKCKELSLLKSIALNPKEPRSAEGTLDVISQLLETFRISAATHEAPSERASRTRGGDVGSGPSGSVEPRILDPQMVALIVRSMKELKKRDPTKSMWSRGELWEKVVTPVA